MRRILYAAVIAFAIARPVVAQETCGWSAPASTPRLPPNVEAIAAQLPASWAESRDALDHLAQWFHKCDDIAGHEAIFAIQRAMRRGNSGEALNALLGTAMMHGPDVQIDHSSGVTNRATYQLSNAERDGARLLAHAALADPKLVVAARELGEVALATRHPPTITIALETLAKVNARSPAGPYLHMAGEIALVARDYNAALKNATAAVALGDSAALHTAGIAQIMLGADSAGAAAYLAGISAPDIPDGVAPVVTDLYYDDISYLLQPADTVAWQMLPLHERADWLRKQWQWRAATSSQSVGERLKLHFTRLAYAIDHFPRTAFRMVPGFNAVMMDTRTRLMSIDDRGLIYVRHGAPDEVIPVSSMKAADETRLAWGYKRLLDGRALFEFTKKDCLEAPPPPAPSAGARRAGARTAMTTSEHACANTGDYYLATPLRCDGRGDASVTYLNYGTSIAQYDPALGLYEVDCYGAVENGASGGEDWKLREAVQRSTAILDGHVAMRTETARPLFTRPLDVAFMTYAMRDGRATQIFGFAGISADGVQPKPNTSDYSLRLQLSVENSRALSAQTVDTTLAFHTQMPLTAGQVVHASVATAASPAADATVRLTVRNQNEDAAGQIVTAARAIPDYSTDALAMSDLVIAETRNGTWLRGNIRLAPIPAHLVAAGSTFRLFYELYGARSDDSLDVHIVIAPGADDNVMAKLKSLVDRKGAIETAFRDRADVDATGTARVVREIGADIEPGRYVMIVRVRDARTNTVAEAHTDLVILKQ